MCIVKYSQKVKAQEEIEILPTISIHRNSHCWYLVVYPAIPLKNFYIYVAIHI